METAVFTKQASEDTRALMFGIAIFSAVLSVPAFFWGAIMLRERGTKRDIASATVAVVTFAFGATYLVVAFVNRLHAVGASLF